MLCYHSCSTRSPAEALLYPFTLLYVLLLRFVYHIAGLWLFSDGTSQSERGRFNQCTLLWSIPFSFLPLDFDDDMVWPVLVLYFPAAAAAAAAASSSATTTTAAAVDDDDDDDAACASTIFYFYLFKLSR